MRRYLLVLGLGVMFLCGTGGCGAPYNDMAVLSERGEKGFLRLSDTVLWLNVPASHRLPQTAEVVVHVRDAQGQPLDGLMVRFAVESSWTPYASFTPMEVAVRHGEARAVFRASTSGVIPIMAHIAQVTLQASITVAGIPNLGDGGS